jgi:hypothetical protein
MQMSLFYQFLVVREERASVTVRPIDLKPLQCPHDLNSPPLALDYIVFIEQSPAATRLENITLLLKLLHMEVVHSSQGRA